MREWMTVDEGGLTESNSYGAIGKGLLTGQIKSLDDLPQNDYRRNFPRFSPENFDANMKLVQRIQALAERKSCTAGQLAVGWLLAISETKGVPKIVPIPGASKAERVQENAKVVELNLAEVAEINDLLAEFEVRGDRYPSHTMHHLNG
jgi:pyridoxine 4-dehydrogenase